MIEQDFGNWLAGFTDGEGCFFIGKTPQCRRQRNFGYFCEFRIGLRRDDEAVLREIVARTGLGSISLISNRWGGAAAWVVRAKQDCVALTEIFDAYPLRAKKAADYAIWREAVRAWMQIQKGRNVSRDYSQMARLKQLLDDLRTGQIHAEMAVQMAARST